MYRQGDILLVPVKKTPKVYEKKEKGKTTLGYGEATGHRHVLEEAIWIVAPETKEQDLFDFAMGKISNNPVFVYVDEGGTVLQHNTHGEIEVSRGLYQVVRQREYSPGELVSVID